jgi:hypothetical protein
MMLIKASNSGNRHAMKASLLTNTLQTFALGVALGMGACGGSDAGGGSATGGAGTGNAGGSSAGTSSNGGGGSGGSGSTGGSNLGTSAGGAGVSGGGGASAGTGGGVADASAGGSRNTGGGGGSGNPNNNADGSADGSRTTGRGGSAAGTGGSATGGGSGDGGPLDCNAAPLTGGTMHCSSNMSGTVGTYSWTIWSSGTGGCLTTFGTPGAFSATWANSGDFLARAGLQWNRTQTFDQLGTISADFAETKTGTAGGFSYVGIYGWSVQPTHEYYIIDDTYGRLPFNPGGTKVGTVMLDGGTYDIITRNMSGASIDGSSSWVQFYSIRQSARTCGHISITEHFKAWANMGLTLGKMEEAKVLIEAGGGSGSINFTTATVTAQ